MNLDSLDLNLRGNQGHGARSLSKFTPTNLSQKVVRSNGQQAAKKPRLEIDKQVNMYSPTTKKLVSNSNNDDYYETFWGDDFDVKALEKVDFDESLAFSQMPACSGVNAGTNVEPSSVTTAATCNSRPIPRQVTYAGKPTTSRPKVNQGHFKTICQSSTSHGVPLRRTASSGSPASGQFPHSYTNNTVKVLPNAITIGSSRGQFENSFTQCDFEQIKKDLEKLKEELSTKNGEVNILRTKQASNQQEFNKQKKEYVDAIKQEAEKNNQLLKENQSLKSQLGVKEMEIETAERKMQLLSTKRLHPDSPINRSPRRLKRDGDVMVNKTQLGCRAYTLSFEVLQQLVKPHLLEPAQTQVSIVDDVRTLKNPGLFSGTDQTRHPLNEGCTSSKSLYVTAMSTLALPEAAQKPLGEVCCSLEPCALALLTPNLLGASSQQAHSIVSQVLDTCQTILRNQLNKLITAAGPLNRRLEREREVQHSAKKLLMITDDSNLLSSRELFTNEKGISTRRALKLLSLLVEMSNHAAKRLVECYNEDQLNVKIKDGIINELNPTNSTTLTLCPILNTLKAVVIQIEAQRRTIMFDGVLAGAMSLAKSVLQTDIELSQECQRVLVDILQAVVFARPGSLVIHNTLQALISATKYPFLMDSICKNSDSCILQVLCISLYTVETPRKHVLSDLFTSWVLTLFYGEQSSPHWLYSVPSQTTCKCRSLVSRLTFNLLGEAICMYPSVPDGTGVKKTLERLLTRGVLMVSTLLYHDEHFGVNVDPPSVGFYELYLYTFNSFNMDLQLNRPCRVILETLCKQEAHRQPINDSEGNVDELNRLLTASFVNTKGSINSGLDYLDSC